MTKNELAEKFASEKVAEFTEAIKEAYLKGYEQGEQQTASSIEVDGVEYVDLGLPSGTLWSRTQLAAANGGSEKLPYTEAIKLNIPNVEQLEELLANTERIINRIRGISGEELVYKCDKYEDLGEYMNRGKNRYWLKDEVDTLNANVFSIGPDYRKVEKRFKGYKYPVFLVKTKDEL